MPMSLPCFEHARPREVQYVILHSYYSTLNHEERGYHLVSPVIFVDRQFQGDLNTTCTCDCPCLFQSSYQKQLRLFKLRKRAQKKRLLCVRGCTARCSCGCYNFRNSGGRHVKLVYKVPNRIYSGQPGAAMVSPGR